MLVRFQGACYRYAADSKPGLLSRAARWFLDKLWGAVYAAGWTYEELSEWLLGVLGTERRAAGWDPDDEDVIALAEQLLTVLAKSGMFPGDILREIMKHKLLDHPPAPYRWEVDNFGRKQLVKTRSEVPEQGIVRGKRFAGKSLIGVWWTTMKQRSRAHKEFVRWLQSKDVGGKIFLNWTIPAEGVGGMGGGREYGAFVLVPTDIAPIRGGEIKERIERVTKAGDGEYRLSGVKLDGLAEGKRIENSDQLRVPGVVNSIKFNWDYTLPTLLNGGVAEYKGQKEYDDLVAMLREARDAAP
jgi:hypothetical protein